MEAMATSSQTFLKCPSRALPERWVRERLVNVIEKFCEPLMQFRKRPDRERLRSNSLRDLTDIAGNLGISPQVVNELGVGRSKQPFTNRAKSCFRWRSVFLNAFIALI